MLNQRETFYLNMPWKVDEDKRTYDLFGLEIYNSVFNPTKNRKQIRFL